MASRPRDWSLRAARTSYVFARGIGLTRRKLSTPRKPAKTVATLTHASGGQKGRRSGYRRTARLSFTIGLILCFLGGCKWFAPKRLSDSERRQIALRFREGIERAGGFGVWVKGVQMESFPPGGAIATVEVLAVPAGFDTAIAVIVRQSEREDLKTQVKAPRSRGGWRTVEVLLSRGGEPVGRWRVRETRQLRRAAIVIDDMGQDREAARQLLELRYPLTFAVLPQLRHTREVAEEAHRAGREVMLHLPMEPKPGSAVAPGDSALELGMRGDEVARIVQADLDSVPYAVGVNNHMGSRATADAALMAEVMKVLGDHRLFFVDSRTTPFSVALDIARRQGLPAFYRSVFLDDTEATAYVLAQLRRFRHVVEEQGAALAIGHPRPTTLAALAQFLPELERDDIQLVPVSQLVQLPEVARLAPPAVPLH